MGEPASRMARAAFEASPVDGSTPSGPALVAFHMDRLIVREEHPRSTLLT